VVVGGGGELVTGFRQPCTGCGHTEMGFSSLELSVGMQRWGSTSLNWACPHPVQGCGTPAMHVNTNLRLSNPTSACPNSVQGSPTQFKVVERSSRLLNPIFFMHEPNPIQFKAVEPSSKLSNPVSACPHPVQGC
jgi:hypothetical protein